MDYWLQPCKGRKGQGRDVVVSLPTGSGKSLCFGLLPMVFDAIHQTSGSIVMVVSPLVALMHAGNLASHIMQVEQNIEL